MIELEHAFLGERARIKSTRLGLRFETWDRIRPGPHEREGTTGGDPQAGESAARRRTTYE